MFTIAKQLAPDDAEVRNALDGALAAADADAGEKQKLADYQKHLDGGRAAMTAQRFDDAIKEFQAALKILPGDRTAAINLKTAQNRLDAGADLAKRQATFADLMERAQDALKARRPDRAIQPLTAALKLSPDDKNVRKMLKAAKLDAETAAAEYNRLLALGDAAMTQQRFEEANRLYAQAAEVLPGDAVATDKARAAANAVTNRQAALVAYQRFMTQAALNAQNQRYPDAIRNYQEALAWCRVTSTPCRVWPTCGRPSPRSTASACSSTRSYRRAPPPCNSFSSRRPSRRLRTPCKWCRTIRERCAV